MKAPVRSFTVLTAAVLAAAHGAAQSSASRDQHRAQREAVVVEALANRASRVREAGRTGAGNNAIDRKPQGAAWIRTAHREQTVHLERRQALLAVRCRGRCGSAEGRPVHCEVITGVQDDRPCSMSAVGAQRL